LATYGNYNQVIRTINKSPAYAGFLFIHRVICTPIVIASKAQAAPPRGNPGKQQYLLFTGLLRYTRNDKEDKGHSQKKSPDRWGILGPAIWVIPNQTPAYWNRKIQYAHPICPDARASGQRRDWCF